MTIPAGKTRANQNTGTLTSAARAIVSQRGYETINTGAALSSSKPQEIIPFTQDGTLITTYIDNFPNQDRSETVGANPIFQIGIAELTKGGAPTGKFDGNWPAMTFELPPARHSMHEKQGQLIPGVSAGMTMMTKTNVAKLPIPGARPVLQGMGMGRETISWVGAFIGFDQYINGNDTREDGTTPQELSITEGYLLFEQFKKQREVLVKLGWTHTDTSQNHSVTYDGKSDFRGYITNVKRIPATDSRTYYQILMVITNEATRGDLKQGTINDDPVDFASTDLSTYPRMEQFYSTPSQTNSLDTKNFLNPGFAFTKPSDTHLTDAQFVSTYQGLQGLANAPVNANDLPGASAARVSMNTYNGIVSSNPSLLTDKNFSNLYGSAKNNVNDMGVKTGIRSDPLANDFSSSSSSSGTPVGTGEPAAAPTTPAVTLTPTSEGYSRRITPSPDPVDVKSAGSFTTRFLK